MRGSLMCYGRTGSLSGSRSGSRFHGVGTNAGIIGLRLPVRSLLFRFIASGICVDRPGLFREDSVFKQCRPRGLSRLVAGSAGSHRSINSLLQDMIILTLADAPCCHTGVISGPRICRFAPRMAKRAYCYILQSERLCAILRPCEPNSLTPGSSEPEV